MDLRLLRTITTGPPVLLAGLPEGEGTGLPVELERLGDPEEVGRALGVTVINTVLVTVTAGGGDTGLEGEGVGSTLLGVSEEGTLGDGDCKTGVPVLLGETLSLGMAV